jgi:hypothetical protein
MKTRDRNAGQALRLFNEQGFGAVSTAALAADGLRGWRREQLRNPAIDATIIPRSTTTNWASRPALAQARSGAPCCAA